MAQRATMATVARIAGVSPMTVSNVLKGKASVSPELRARVEAAVQETGYRLNVTARTLRSGRSGVIGLIVPGIDQPYFGMLGHHIVEAARPHGVHVAIETAEYQVDSELDALERARLLAYDGVIITPLTFSAVEWDQIPADFPMVFLGERDTPTGTAHISLPNEEGSRAATAHLIARGARRIALVNGRPSVPDDMFVQREAGYRRALADAGIDLDPDLLLPLETGPHPASGRAAVHAAHAAGLRPDAYLAVTDSTALGVLRGLADLGIRAPEDVLVCGFDGVPAGEHAVPSLSTISPDHAWIAGRAVEMLLAQIGSADPAQHSGAALTAPFTLVERESTAR